MIFLMRVFSTYILCHLYNYTCGVTWICFLYNTIDFLYFSYGGWISSQTFSHHSEMKVYVTGTGILLILIYCCISGTAGVYTGKVAPSRPKINLSTWVEPLFFGRGQGLTRRFSTHWNDNIFNFLPWKNNSNGCVFS